MGITEISRRIWLFHASKTKSCESFKKQPTQLIIAAHNCPKTFSSGNVDPCISRASPNISPAISNCDLTKREDFSHKFNVIIFYLLVLQIQNLTYALSSYMSHNVLCQPKNLTAFSASSKTFMPTQKPISLNAKHLFVWHKMFVTATI